MNTVGRILIGCRILAAVAGLSVMGSGCGGGTSGTGSSTPGLSQEEIKRNEDTKKAMEEAAKANKPVKGAKRK